MSTRLRIGLLGFGHIGRELYRMAQQQDDLEIPVIVDIGEPAILHYLLESEARTPASYQLSGFVLRGPRFSSRLLQTDRPAEPPWDAFGVDCVIDATRHFGTREQVNSLLANGARRVFFANLPQTAAAVDRVVVPGVNLAGAAAADQAVCAGSPTTTASALMLGVLAQAYDIQAATLTSVHAYSSDQPVQDYAGTDCRRSRSAAENIIPNSMPAVDWLPALLPALAGRISGFAMNVPVQHGSMLDLSAVLAGKALTPEAINAVFEAAAARHPALIGVATDPIVSSDVIGERRSLIFDSRATLVAGARTVKLIGWHESLGQACRTLEVVRHYAGLDAAGGAP